MAENSDVMEHTHANAQRAQCTPGPMNLERRHLALQLLQGLKSPKQRERQLTPPKGPRRDKADFPPGTRGWRALG